MSVVNNMPENSREASPHQFVHLYWLSVLYLMIPVVIFILGWMQWYVAFPLLGISLVCGWREYGKDQDRTGWKSFLAGQCTVKNTAVWGALLLWLVLSGWGNITFQHPDFIVRNAVLGALTLESWPIQYSQDTYFCYYFISYLPAALCGKMFGLGAAHFLLLMWFTLGLYLVWSWVCRYVHSSSNLILCSLVLFGSLSSLRLLFQYLFPGSTHEVPFISIAQQVTLTAHQAIPVMLLICMLVAGKMKVERAVLILVMTVLYSPLCTLVMLALFLAWLAGENMDCWKGLFSPFNTVFGIMGVLFVLFMSNNCSASESSRFLYPYFNIVFWFYWCTSFVFYSIFCIKDFRKNLMFYSVVVSALLLPCFYMGNDINDFACKGSLVCTFALLLFVLKSVFSHPGIKKKLYILCLIGGGALMSCPLGLYLSCTPWLLDFQNKIYGCVPDSRVKSMLLGKTYFPHMRHQHSWNNTMHHPEHYWYPNFTGLKNGFLCCFYKFPSCERRN